MNWKLATMVAVLAVIVGGYLPTCKAAIEANVTHAPETPAAHTVLILPDNHATNPVCQDWLNGFAKDPTLVKLRRNTQVQTYTASNPDLRHRFKSDQSLPQLRDGKPVLIVEAGTTPLYAKAGGTVKDMSREMNGLGLLEKLRNHCPCGPKNGPKPNTETVQRDTSLSPISPLLPPIDEEEEEEPAVVPVKKSKVFELCLIAGLAVIGGVFAYFRSDD